MLNLDSRDERSEFPGVVGFGNGDATSPGMSCGLVPAHGQPGPLPNSPPSDYLSTKPVFISRSHFMFRCSVADLEARWPADSTSLSPGPRSMGQAESTIPFPGLYAQHVLWRTSLSPDGPPGSELGQKGNHKGSLIVL